MKHIILSTVVAAASALSLNAGINSPGVEGRLDRGRAMYDDANYAGCVDQLHGLNRELLTIEQAEEADWLLACSAMHLDGGRASESLRQFLNRYPASVHRHQAAMYIGDCLMSVNYGAALSQYLSIDPDALSVAERADLVYHTSFCRLKLGEYDAAARGFEQLAKSRAYGNAARFYLGYIAYAKHDYIRAKELFGRVNTATAPGNMADYYLCQIYYSESDWNKALTTARKLLNRQDIDAEYTAEASRIAGEALYRMGRSDEAIPYLQRYLGAVETPALSSLYILGLSQYLKGDYQDAVKSLDTVSASDDAMGQSALLYIGQAQLNLGNTDSALMALERALRQNHDKAVQEAAFYNYAVAKYRGGRVPFGSSVTVFEEFLDRFPDSKYAPEVQTYVVNGWINDNNYEQALASIERMSKPTAPVVKAHQQVLYALGNRALARGDNDAAVKYLTRLSSFKNPDRETAAQGALVLAQAYARQGEYQKALAAVGPYISWAGASDPNFMTARYDRGYALFNLKRYKEAARDFELVAKHNKLPADYQADALNRLADIYYYNREFDKAATTYTEAYQLNPTAGDYPLFQQALMKGHQRDFAAKKALLNEMLAGFEGSALKADALLELAETEYSLSGGNDATATAYRRVIREAPATAQARQAYLRLGSLQLTGGQRSTAIETFKELIAGAPTSDEAALAADYLKRIGAEDGTLAQVRQWLEGVDNAPRIDVAEADRITFVAAEEAYLDHGTTERLESYIAEYPDGASVAAALGYLLEDANAAGDTPKALDYANRLTERYPDNIRAEEALLTIADIHYGRGEMTDALKAYRRLEKSASSTATLNAARAGVMRTALETGNWAEAASAADLLLQASTLGNGEKSEAMFAKGLALAHSGQTSAARLLWQQAADDTDDEFGAKSAYYLAQSYLDAGQLDDALDTATYLTGSHTPHSYWLARGFIVLSDVLRRQGKTFEADSYLEALRNNYPGSEADIFQMIETRLKK